MTLIQYGKEGSASIKVGSMLSMLHVCNHLKLPSDILIAMVESEYD